MNNNRFTEENDEIYIVNVKIQPLENALMQEQMR